MSNQDDQKSVLEQSLLEIGLRYGMNGFVQEFKDSRNACNHIPKALCSIGMIIRGDNAQLSKFPLALRLAEYLDRTIPLYDQNSHSPFRELIYIIKILDVGRRIGGLIRADVSAIDESVDERDSRDALMNLCYAYFGVTSADSATMIKLKRETLAYFLTIMTASPSLTAEFQSHTFTGPSFRPLFERLREVSKIVLDKYWDAYDELQKEEEDNQSELTKIDKPKLVEAILGRSERETLNENPFSSRHERAFNEFLHDVRQQNKSSDSVYAGPELMSKLNRL